MQGLKLSQRIPYGRNDCLHQKSLQHLKLQEQKQLIKQKQLTKQMEETSSEKPSSEKPSNVNSSIKPQVVVVPVDQGQHQAPSNPQNAHDTNPPPHIHIPNTPTKPSSTSTKNFHCIYEILQHTCQTLSSHRIPQLKYQIQCIPKNPPAHVPNPVQPPNLPHMYQIQYDHQIPHCLCKTQCNLKTPKHIHLILCYHKPLQFKCHN